MNRVEALLRQEIGLDAASIGPTSVARAAQSRMKLLGLKTVDDYYRLLESSPTERAELVEAIVVTETWFFRDRNSFKAFTQLALEWLAANPKTPLRVLSVPCSSGEEPYTLAMCLLDANVPPERFIIDAADVSARTLARAITGVYGKNSFRGEDLAFRERHFKPVQAGGYKLSEQVRNCVRFRQDNLLNGQFLAGSDPYPFIFCRNVLIYFDHSTQAAVLEVLNKRLAKGGFLFVGPAEMPIFLDTGFISADFPMAFACIRSIDAHASKRAVPPPQAKTPRPTSPSASLPPPTKSIDPAPTSNGSALSATPPAQSASETPNLEIAHRLADAGKLSEAVTLCEEHIRANGPSVQAYYLIGLVLDSRGEPGAADYYRKALYLDPDHYETLWHMALLIEKNGDPHEAASLKRRAQKMQKKPEDRMPDKV